MGTAFNFLRMLLSLVLLLAGIACADPVYTILSWSDPTPPSPLTVTFTQKLVSIDYNDYMRFVPQGEGSQWREQDNVGGIWLPLTAPGMPTKLSIVIKNQVCVYMWGWLM